MNNIIPFITEIITTETNNNLKRLIEEKQDISQFIIETKKALDTVGVNIVKDVLEFLDETVRESDSRKQEWHVHEKKPNTLATTFGEVHYVRTYYKNKHDGSYASLSDEMVGIEAHDKMDLSLKAKCIEGAIKHPYRQSGKDACDALDLSGQAVMDAIRWLGPVPLYEVPEGQEKREVEYLFIEADEDHVAMRGRRAGEPKLVYVHEGVTQVSKKRWELKNPVYFSGMFRESEELWAGVEDYIDMAYERDKIKKIYLSGDRGLWIRSGAKWLKDVTYVVDKYHVLKYIRQAAGHIENGCDAIWEAIRKQDREYLEIVFETIKDHPDSDGKNLQPAFRYIRESFAATKHYFDEMYPGCSAEGHVSHILSDRLSSRPRVWGERGIDEMARLRVAVKNGEEIYALMLKTKKERMQESRQVQINEKIIEKRKLVAGAEMQHNLPWINRGQLCGSLKTIKSFRGI